jgi:phage terminase large subunit GpA-like protein
LYIVGVDSLKTSLYSRLSNETPGADYIHFPVREQLTVEWFEQLIHEKVIIENDKNGYPRRVWINPNNKRNEAMDIMNYAEAAHSSLNVDHEARLSSLYQGRKKTAADVARKMKGLS